MVSVDKNMPREKEDNSSDEEEQMSEEEDDASEEDESREDLELDASDTESDTDTEESESSDVSGGEHDEKPTKTRAEVEAEKIVQKYKERQGKQMYVRFPSKLPLEEAEFQKKAHSLSPLIIKAHKPRQKHARFCLVDFKSVEDRNVTLEKLKNAAKTDVAFKGIVVSIPRTENDEFVKELAEQKSKALENKKAKTRLRRESKLALRAKYFTTSVVVLNLPKSASMLELRKVFPNAVDIQMKPSKGKLHGANVAVITLSSTMEARSAVKQSFSMGDTKLIVRFDKQSLKKKQTKSKQKYNSKLQLMSPDDVASILQAKQKRKKSLKEDTAVVLRDKKSKKDVPAKAAVSPIKSETSDVAVVTQTKKSKKAEAVNASTGPPAKKTKHFVAEPVIGKKKKFAKKNEMNEI